jgi:hypothetical protein
VIATMVLRITSAVKGSTGASVVVDNMVIQLLLGKLGFSILDFGFRFAFLLHVKILSHHEVVHDLTLVSG